MICEIDSGANTSLIGKEQLLDVWKSDTTIQSSKTRL